MQTATLTPRASASNAPSPLRRTAIAVAGPALIVVSVLVALRGIAFLPRLTDQHPDVLSFWLPRSCLLGRSIAQGHVPLWNPFEMIGTPFAADAQSGWLSLAMGIAASNVAISLPFSSTLAWSPFVLVGASGWFSSSGWRRFGWLALGAFAWGQVAAAHLSHGLLMATGLALAYVVARALHEVRGGRLTGRRALCLAVAFLGFLPLANLAVLVPRFALLARSSLGQGYQAFEGTVAGIGGTEDLPIMPGGIWAAWPLALASAPRGDLPAPTLLLLSFPFRDRARRFLALTLSVVGVGAYLLTISLLVGVSWFRE